MASESGESTSPGAVYKEGVRKGMDTRRRVWLLVTSKILRPHVAGRRLGDRRDSGDRDEEVGEDRRREIGED